MALKVGDLYVAVTASIGEALVSVGKLVKGVERAAKQVKEAAEPIGNIGAVVAAGIAAAVAASAESNAAMKEQTERIKDLLITLAAELGDLFAPLVKKVANVIEQVVAKLQSLSPATKRAGAGIAAWVAGVGLGVGAVGKLAGAMEGMTKGMALVLETSKKVLPAFTYLGEGAGKAFQAIQALSKVDIGKALAGMKSGVAGLGTSVAELTTSMPSLMASIGRMALGFATAALPILAVVAALAGIALLAGSVYKSWGDIKLLAKEAWSAMSQSVSEMMGGLSDVAMKLADVFGLAFSALGSTIEAMVDRSLAFVAFLVSKSASILRPIAEAAKMHNVTGALKEAEKLTGKGLKAGILDALAAGGSAFIEKMAKEASELKKGAVLIATKAADAAKAAGAAAKDTVGVGLQHSASGLEEMMKAVLNSKTVEEWKAKMEDLKGLLASLFDGNAQAHIRKPDENGIEVSAAGHDGMDRFAERFRGGLGSTAMDAYNKLVEDQAKALADSIRRAAEDAAAAAAAAKDSLIAGFVNRLGELGGIINSAKQGFEAGGFWGAVIAAIGELLMGTEEMAGAIEILNGIVSQVSDIFGAIGRGLQPLLGAVGYVIEVVVNLIQPFLEMLGDVLEDFAPVIVMVGEILQALTPVLSGAFKALASAISWLVEGVLKGVFEVLRYVGLAILYIIKGLASAWNGIVSAIQWVFKKLGDISIFGGHPLGFLRDWADGMESAKINTDSLNESISNLKDVTWDAAKRKAEETAEVLKNKEALADVNEALSNVPALWKVALRRFNAQDEQEGPNTSGGSATPAPAQPPPSPSGGGTVSAPESPGGSLFNYIFNITGYDTEEAMAEAMRNAEAMQRRLGIRLFGTAAPVTSRYA
ncbi:hypothetical protein [Corallococcus sp. CA047B]|uniref:hypothetical protein n=1 Tax=Corallococcus sp. CA047B TaxID=2316729 RepID=UPI0011C3F9A7|nr:hypothetical protein [Corallococcus sp. CA047B]